MINQINFCVCVLLRLVLACVRVQRLRHRPSPLSFQANQNNRNFALRNHSSLLVTMSNFDPDAILRGAQLTLVGAHRAMQNPRLFTSEHYKQAALAVAAGLAISLLIKIPVISNFHFHMPMLIDLGHCRESPVMDLRPVHEPRQCRLGQRYH
jgi:hypothetical protein